MSLKTVVEANFGAQLALAILAILVLGGILAFVAIAASKDRRGSAPSSAPTMQHVRHEDDLEQGVRCYWLYTGSGGGIAMSCVPLAADAGLR